MSDRRKWHFDKALSATDLITALTMVAGLIWYGSQFQNRLDMQQEALRRVDEQVATERRFRDTQRAEDRQATQQTLSDLQLQIRSMDTRLTDRLEKIADKVGARK